MSNYKKARDEKCVEYMHSYKGTSAENNTEAFGGFMAGWNACARYIKSNLPRKQMPLFIEEFYPAIEIDKLLGMGEK